MKFLCVQCDQPMKLQGVDDSGGGSLSVRYGCPTCDAGFAMLTNPFETEMVQSLGVRIGPSEAGGEMAEGARAAGKCPFSGVIAGMGDGAGPEPGGSASPVPGRTIGPIWTAEALSRLEGIPEFVRPMARQGIEHYARSNGFTEIDERVLEQARQRFGM
jgi:Proto-chlorophyllide reductase 57 kD subunit